MVSLNVGPGGGILPAMDGRTKVEFPPGALTKPTNVMIQSFPILSNCCPAAFAAGPILTLEPRRRRFHQNVNYYIPAPSIDLAVFNCHILCSITEGKCFQTQCSCIVIIAIQRKTTYVKRVNRPFVSSLGCSQIATFVLPS